MAPKNIEKFCVDEFVNNLLSEGKQTPCDETGDDFERPNLPQFYDEEKFKRGQKFYHSNIFGMFLSKLMGLVAILSVPSILKILKFTNLSSEPKTAYKRYLATIYHMKVWYDRDFKPGSDLWKSIDNVRSRHNVASKRADACSFQRISQMDMALTQFGFMGFAIVRSKSVGIFNANNKDVEAFIHVWRVIGYLMGIDDRFNICRESIEETKQICELLIQNMFKPQIKKRDPDFIQMAHALINGMWAMNPMIEPFVHIVFLIKLVNNKNNDSLYSSPVFEMEYEKLDKYQKFKFWLMESTMSTYRFFTFRIYYNALMYMTFWLMQHFPFLALYKYGREESYVHILNSSTNRDSKT